ncbi:MAG: hypothetical protein ABIR06_11685 [Cyclobacteriaceae bacterium]
MKWKSLLNFYVQKWSDARFKKRERLQDTSVVDLQTIAPGLTYWL